MSATKKTILAAALLLAAAALVFLYYNIDPAHVAWMPRCPFRWLTGWQCPACGNQRALHALLHGHLAEAWAFNPFLLLSRPYLTLLVAATALRRQYPRLYTAVAHRRVVASYLLLLCLWWLLRNLY